MAASSTGHAITQATSQTSTCRLAIMSVTRRRQVPSDTLPDPINRLPYINRNLVEIAEGVNANLGCEFAMRPIGDMRLLPGAREEP